MTTNDGITWRPYAHVAKYSPEQVASIADVLGYEPTAEDFKALEVTPSAEAEAHGNLLTTAGLQRITNLIIASGAQGLTATRTAVGVGATATAATVTDTALGANGGSAWYQVVDGAPTAVNGVLTAVSTFNTTSGNFAWNEWCWAITNGAITPSATLASIGTTPQIINHKIASLGTKVSGSVWVFTTTITLS